MCSCPPTYWSVAESESDLLCYDCNFRCSLCYGPSESECTECVDMYAIVNTECVLICHEGCATC